MKFPLFFLFLAVANISFAQSPVSWSVSLKAADDGTATVHFDADIDDGWVIYGLQAVEDGPLPTQFELDSSDGYAPLGGIMALDESIVKNDELFGMTLEKYKGKARFEQMIQVKDPSTNITGYLSYMTCNGEQCLPPTDIDFDLPIQ